MTSIVIINYSGQKQKDLEEQAVLQFVSDLRRVQSMAMAVAPCNNEIQDKYGIETSGNSYEIFGMIESTKCPIATVSLAVTISAGEIFFLPIRQEHPTIEIEGIKNFTIGTTSITISDEGKITY